MSASNFNLIRDLLFLSAIFLGLGLGLLACCKKPNTDKTTKKRFITAAICLAAIFIGLLSPVIILSKGYFIFQKGLLIAFLIITIFFGTASFFPIQFGFPLIIVISFAMLYCAYYFFRYPNFNSIMESGKYLSILNLRLEDKAIVEFADNIIIKKSGRVQSYNINTIDITVDYKINTLKVNRLFPVFGSKIYVIPITINLIDKDGFKLRVLTENKTQKSLFNNILQHPNRIFYAKSYSGEIILEKKEAPRKTLYELFFTGNELQIVP